MQTLGLSAIRKGLRHAAAELILEVCRAKPIRVEQIQLGVMTFKFAVTSPTNERFVVRFYPPSRAQVAGYEPALLRRFAEAGLRTPEVVMDSNQGPQVGLPYVIYRMIDGIPLSDRLPLLAFNSLVEVAGELNRFLEALQTLDVRGYGELVTANRAPFHRSVDFVERVFSDGLRIATEVRLWPPKTLRALEMIGSNIATLLREHKGVLAWGDLAPDHVLLSSRNEIVGLVDFEGVMAADPLLSFGYCYARFCGMPFFEALVRSLSRGLSHGEWQQVQLYAIVRGLRLACFARVPRAATRVWGSVPGRRLSPSQRHCPGTDPGCACQIPSSEYNYCSR